MAVFKTIKTFVRKALFHPLGYDIVPFRKEMPGVPPIPRIPKKPRPKLPSGNDQLERYVALFGEKAVQARHFYNVGASKQFAHPAWTKVNHPSDHYGHDTMDIAWDLTSNTPLPIETGSACVIYSRYTLEHIPDLAVAHFLSEAHRALKPGGYLRVVVPDVDLFYTAYQNRDGSLFDRGQKPDSEFPNTKFLSNPDKASFEQRFLWVFASNATTLHADGAPRRISDKELRRVLDQMSLPEALDYCTSRCSPEVQRRHPEDHINWFNADKLLGMVAKAGFEQVYRSGCGQSRCPVLRDTRLFDARRPEIGLYVEAIK